jgi:hypothetical protein
MKMLKIKIKEGSRDWGIFNILQINWRTDGKIISVVVDWYKDNMLSLPMSDKGNGIFVNVHGNLTGEIQHEEAVD